VVAATSELAASEARLQEAQSSLEQASQELQTKLELRERNSPSVAPREIERLQILVGGRQAAVATAIANKGVVSAQISSVLPAQKASAEAQLAEAQVELDKTTVRAGVDGQLEQFTLRKGDIVNPLMRPAGVLIPSDSGRWGLIAGFNQLESQVIKVGMLAEVTCISKPMTVIPMVVVDVQGLIATGQLRASDQLIDTQQVAAPGTLTAYLEPLFEGGFADVPPGSKCLANAYTSNHDRLDNEDLGTMTWLYLHMIDAVGVVHAIILRIHALLLPIQTLVFSGGH
jgi:multidrug resistance efflux pump